MYLNLNFQEELDLIIVGSITHAANPWANFEDFCYLHLLLSFLSAMIGILMEFTVKSTVLSSNESNVKIPPNGRKRDGRGSAIRSNNIASTESFHRPVGGLTERNQLNRKRISSTRRLNHIDIHIERAC